MQPPAAPERSDEELVESYQRIRCREDLDLLLGRYVARLRGTIFAMVLDPTDADDLTQEVLLRAIRGLPGFNGQSTFSTWLYRVAVNTTHRFLRQRAGTRGDGTAALPERAARPGDWPEQKAIGAETGRQITAAMAELSPSLRAAMAMVVLDGMSAGEAAEIEGCSVATMYWRVHRARRILAQRLSRYLAP